MKNDKIHRIDLIFIIGIIVIAMLGGISDAFYWKDYEGVGGFPVYCCMSIFGSYALWIILLIYSSITFKEPELKPRYVKWYMYFILPFFHIILAMIGMGLTNFVIKLLGI